MQIFELKFGLDRMNQNNWYVYVLHDVCNDSYILLHAIYLPHN